MPIYRMCIAYDGTDFGGWQRQSSGPPTIQGQLEDILSRVENASVRLIGSGRTDRGVHARGQVAHFHSRHCAAEDMWLSALRRMTPDSIWVRSLTAAHDGFHAQRDAQAKSYVYLIRNCATPSPFMRRFSWHCPFEFDLAAANHLAAVIVGKHDFASFQSRGTVVQSTIRNIFKAEWYHLRPSLIAFRIIGNGFLKQMVRNLVGAQIELLKTKASARDQATSFGKLLEGCDRRLCPAPAPPQGLYLERVWYPPRRVFNISGASVGD